MSPKVSLSAESKSLSRRGHPDSERIRTQLLAQAFERGFEHRQDPRRSHSRTRVPRRLARRHGAYVGPKHPPGGDL